MQGETSHQRDPALHDPAVAYEFATSNSTSNHFLGTAQRSWMTAIGAAVPPAPAPLVATTKVNKAANKSNSLSTRVQKERDANTATGDDSHGRVFTDQSRKDDLPTEAIAHPTAHPTNITRLYITPAHDAFPNHPNHDIWEARANHFPESISNDRNVRLPETVTQSSSTTRPVPSNEPPQPAQVATVTSTNPLSPSALPATPQADWHLWQTAEALRFPAGPATSPTTTMALNNTQTQPSATHPPAVMSPISMQAPPSASRKRLSEVRDGGRRTRSRSDGPSAAEMPTPSTTPTLPPNPYLVQIVDSTGRLRQQSLLNAIDEQRISLLRDACHSSDMVYIILHQVYCVVSVDRTPLINLGFAEPEFAGLGVLEPILVHNSRLTEAVLSLFANFPSQPYSLFEPASAQTLTIVRNFLRALGMRWDVLRNTCRTRGYPPSAMELCFAFSLPSPAMQKTLYNSIHRQVSGVDNSEFGTKAIDLFIADQARFRQKQAAITYDLVVQDAHRFGHMYLKLKHYFGLLPQQILNRERRSSIQSPIDATFGGPYVPSRQHTVQQIPPQHLHQYPVPPAPPGNFVHANPAYIQGAVPAVLQHQVTNSMSPSHPGSGLVGTVNHALSGQPQLLSINAQRRRPPPTFVNGMKSSPVESPLLPPPGYPVPYTTNPNPDRVALHQAHLRSPEPRNVDASGQQMPGLRLYQYVKDFLLEPQRVDSGTKYAEWHFNIDPEAFSQRARDIPALSQISYHNVRLFRPGNYVYRLKATSQDASIFAVPNASEYDVAATTWPQCCFISLNDYPDVEFRRKQHHARDLPADLTNWIRPGHNILKLSNHSIMEEAKKVFFFAVECIHVADHSEVAAMPSKLPAADSLASITSVLQASQDDEISFADPYISIDLADPIMATVWRTPVRGIKCKHRECFDLQAFLNSRTSKVKDGPTNPDQWTCPICKKDARPQNLVIDDFMLQVRHDLEAKGQLDARAILVKPDGSWEAKFGKDKKDSSPRQASAPVQAAVSEQQSSLGTGLDGMAASNGVTVDGKEHFEVVILEAATSGPATPTTDALAGRRSQTPATAAIIEILD